MNLDLARILPPSYTLEQFPTVPRGDSPRWEREGGLPLAASAYDRRNKRKAATFLLRVL